MSSMVKSCHEFPLAGAVGIQWELPKMGGDESFRRNIAPSISIIVPVHNGGGKFRRCLLSILAARPEPEEIIVVADGDTDGSGAMAEDMGIKVISTGPSPLGPAGARNAGAEAATEQILFFVDADVEIHGDCVSLIREFFRENPDVAAVIGSYDDAPFETNFLSQFKNLFHCYTHQTARIEASTFWGACGAIRREIFFGVDGFDQRFARPSIEDIELGYRLIKSGYRIRLLKNLQVKHLKQWRFRMLLKSDIFDRALPWTRLIHQQGKILSDLNLKIADRISCAVIFGLILTLPFVFINNWVWIVTGFFFAVILISNRNLYLYLLRLRGGVFALKSILFHQFYLFYSGLSFMYGKMTWYLKKCSPIDHASVIDSRRGNP